MTAIVISNGHILVNGEDRYSLDFEAYCIKGEIGIRHINQRDLTLFKGRVKPTEITLNAIAYDTAIDFVYAFNALTAPALSYLMTSMKANTDYPNTHFSANITANAEQQIADYEYPGSVIVRARDTNSGVVYVGPSPLGATSGGLQPGASTAFEAEDLSLLYALNASNGDVIDVWGSYRQ